MVNLVDQWHLDPARLAFVVVPLLPHAVEMPVITAIVLVHVEADRIPEVAEAIAALEGVSEVYSVTGDADLIAMVRVREHEELADVIADRISKVNGIQHTETHIAFRTYSKHDLDAAFSIGVEDAD